MDRKNRLLMEACVGFFNSMNLCYKQYDKEMRQLRMRFYNRLESKLRANIRIHQLNLMNIIEVMHSMEFEKPKSHKRRRTLWMKKRSTEWFDSICASDDEFLWVSNFRMDQETFLYLCETLENELRAKPNAVREAVPIKSKIAAAIYKLATNEPYSMIGEKFGIHGISVQKALYQFCEACYKLIYKEYIYMPEDEEILDIMQQFEDKIALPQVVGVMEGTRISISYKAIGIRKHMMEKGSNDIVLHTIIDPNSLFRNLAFLENYDDFIEYYSEMKQTMLVMPQKDIQGIPVPAYLISRGNEAVHWWMMKPYSEVNTPEQELFNDFLSKSSAVAEQTLRKLKGRWKILQGPLNISVSYIPKILATCCILHNILEMKGVEYDQSLGDELDNEQVLYSGPMEDTEESCATGEAIRDHLKNYICSQFS